MARSTENAFLEAYHNQLADGHSFADAHGINQSHREHLKVAMAAMEALPPTATQEERDAAQAEVDRHCENVADNNHERPIGAWEKIAYKVVREDFITNGVRSTYDIFGVPQDAVARFGERVAEARLKAVGQLVRDTVLLTRAQRTTKWDEFAQTLNDITLTCNSGRFTYTEGANLPDMLTNEQTFTFDAPGVVVISNIILADDTPEKVLTLNIPPHYKAVLTVSDGTNTETITDNASGIYALSGTDFNAQFNKLTGLYRDRTVTIRAEAE